MRAGLERTLDDMRPPEARRNKVVINEITWSDFEWRERWVPVADYLTKDDEIWYVTANLNLDTGKRQWWVGHKDHPGEHSLPVHWQVVCKGTA